jgi:hypothetical protein
VDSIVSGRIEFTTFLSCNLRAYQQLQKLADLEMQILRVAVAVLVFRNLRPVAL